MIMSDLIHYVVIFSSLFRLHTCWTNWILATPGNVMKFQYKFEETPGRYYISPETDILWSWTTYHQLTGTYYYTSDNGATGSTFQCNGGEDGSHGVGCSNGGGNTQKVLPMNYNNDYDPSSGLAQICQNQPGIFSDDPGDHACQTEINIFFKFCLNALGGFCSDWILATSSNLDIRFRYKFQQTAGRYYISPQSHYLWSWTTYQELTGTYYYTSNNGATGSTFECNGGEAGQYGVGCSNGPGATHKVLPINTDYDPSSGLAQICQDQPGIFSDDVGDGPCQAEIDIYFSIYSTALDGEIIPEFGIYNKYIPYKDVIVMVSLFINAILITVCCWFICSKRNNKKEYKLVNMQTDLSETDDAN